MAYLSSYRKEILLLIASVVFSLFLAEVVLRLHYVLSYSGTLEDLESESSRPAVGADVKLGDMLAISDSPRLIYQLMPDLDVEFHDSSVRTNSAGWREGELPEAKSPGTIRIVGLGDSVMFGWRVEESERFMDLLEVSLGQKYPERRWESVTLAVPGYNLVMEVEALKKVGLAYSPDLIVYGFSYNDFCLPNFVTNREDVWSFDSFLRFYLTRRAGMDQPQLIQRLEALVQQSTGERIGDRDPMEFYSTFCSPDNVAPEHRDQVGGESFLRAVRELVDLGRERGIPVVFLHYANGFADLGERSTIADSWVGETLAEVQQVDGLEIVDLGAGFRQLLAEGLDRRDLAVSEGDRHPSPLGHRIIAEMLEEQLVEKGLIDRLMAAGSPASDAGGR